jgi:hypothetical protein
MWFINQKVVCVDARFPLCILEWASQLPCEGRIYTIRVIVCGKSIYTGELKVGFRLQELQNGERFGFFSERFAPMLEILDQACQRNASASPAWVRLVTQPLQRSGGYRHGRNRPTPSTNYLPHQMPWRVCKNESQTRVGPDGNPLSSAFGLGIPTELFHFSIRSECQHPSADWRDFKVEGDERFPQHLAIVQEVNPLFAFFGNRVRLWLTIAGKGLRFGHPYKWRLLGLVDLRRSLFGGRLCQ